MEIFSDILNFKHERIFKINNLPKLKKIIPYDPFIVIAISLILSAEYRNKITYKS